MSKMYQHKAREGTPLQVGIHYGFSPIFSFTFLSMFSVADICREIVGLMPSIVDYY